jgi:aminoglycoside phosphotransferase (APT) family kinase protein
VQPTPGGDPVDLGHWFSAHVAGATDAPVHCTLISGGRSNLTFVANQGNAEWVLRRPPLGDRLPSAHDMDREFTVISALWETPVAVPRTYAADHEGRLLGVPFYVMERVHGEILRSAEDAVALSKEQAAQTSRDLAGLLADIHAVDVDAVGLAGFGRPTGYLERQLRRWTEQWQRSGTRPLPDLDTLAAKLRESMPAHSESALLHGDFRLDNIMLDPAEDMKPNAVLDWEMSTLGDPLTDLGLMMVYWTDPDDVDPPPSVARQTAGNAGFLTRAEVVDEYVRHTGRDVSGLQYYVAFGYFKLAIIFEGIHRRYLNGNTLGDGYANLGNEVPLLARQGLNALVALDQGHEGG